MSLQQIYLQYHKWNKKDSNSFFKSLQDILHLYHPQFYIPIFSLFFYIHNTKNSHKTIDFKRRFFVHKIINTIKEKYYNSNTFLTCSIYDSHKNIYKTTDIFCKSIPILDPIHIVSNNYNKIINRNQNLPSLYNYNTFQKINSMDNTAYIDIFCSYLVSEISDKNLNPSFPKFYGSVNGEQDYKYDITEEYYDLRVDKCFNKNIGKGFTIDIYISDEDDEDDEDESNKSYEKSSISNSLSSYSSSDSSKDYKDDYIAHIKKTPVQLLFIEKLEGTLEDLLNDTSFTQELLLSGLFQITFALTYMQKHYQFTHNDLHINNIMYTSTSKKFIYYKFNNKYYRVPTFGKIFKIIDFGRAIFTFKNKTYMNDVFSDKGEAGGQYKYPSQVSFLDCNDKNTTEPNYHFDLCRLSMTILDEISTIDECNLSDTMMSFLQVLCSDKYNHSFCDYPDNFDLYISIAKDACNSLPRDTLSHSIFKKYRISKKLFPKKSYYSL
jgi:hypothetical protein